MRAWIFVGVFILLYQHTLGKPLTRKAKREATELIREKREEIDEDERSTEMQKFVLDLSSKEDMSRLKERFKSGSSSQDLENDVEYRRLKRFSIHDDDDVIKRETSENLDGTKTYGDKSKRSDDEKKFDVNKSKRSEDKTTSEPKENIVNDGHHVDFIRMNTEDSDTAGSDISYNSQDEHDENVSLHHIVGERWELIHHVPKESLSSLITTTNNTTVHSEYLPDDVMAQYDSDDVTQYKRTGKSRRKPRVSQAKVTRSVESDYEVREISEVDDPTEQSSRDLTEEKVRDLTEESSRDPVEMIARDLTEDSSHDVTIDSSRDSPESLHEDKVEMVNSRAIKRDGYIGCFIDQHPKRDLKKLFTVNNLTPDSCRSVCKDKGHIYAGVQYGYLCHCGNEYGRYGKAGEHECDSACRGDEEKKCGGFWRNSVYASDLSDTDDTEERDHQLEDTTSEWETRSHIDRVIPIPQSDQEELPVRQEITVYLRSEIPKKNENHRDVKNVIAKDTKNIERTNSPVTNSKRSKIPVPNVSQVKKANEVFNTANSVQAKKRTGVKMPYLHPQKSQREFVPSNVVLRTLTPSSEKKKYTGFIKLKQNWDDGLINKRNPKTLILAGNIESAFAEAFADDPDFEKAEVLSLREASIRDNPDTVHKVVAEFALVFNKAAQKKEDILRKNIKNSSRLGDMPVFSDSLDVKEYNSEKHESITDTVVPKEKRQDHVDAFLEKVFRQI